MRKLIMCILLLISSSVLADTVLITSLSGAITLEGTDGKARLDSFMRLKSGDRITLDKAASLSLLFIESGRQENWQGTGSVSIGNSAGQIAAGKPIVQVKQIPADIARQMNRMPSNTQDGRVGMLRMRSVPSHDAVARLERRYSELREAGAPGDLTADLFLLAGLFDLRQYERVRSELDRLSRDFPRNANVAELRELYLRTLPEAESTSR